jgi:hypothetical protein
VDVARALANISCNEENHEVGNKWIREGNMNLKKKGTMKMDWRRMIEG